MDFKKLLYFLTIADEGQITKAAKRLHMAQPPLSHQLKVFEQELGVQLLERGSRSIQLTEIGCTLRDRGRQIIELVTKTKKEIEELHLGLQGTLAIGTVPALGPSLLPYIEKFHRQFPGIKFRICEGNGHHLLDSLEHGVIDIAIIRLPFDGERFSHVTLPSEPAVAAIPEIFYTAVPHTSLTLHELIELPLIVHRNHKTILDYCQEHSLTPNLFSIQDDVRSMLMWANAGLGIAIVPRSATLLTPAHHLHYLEITHTFLHLDSALIWPKHGYVSTTTQKFVEMFL